MAIGGWCSGNGELTKEMSGGEAPGVSQPSLSSISRPQDPTVNIGKLFEARIIFGLPLFDFLK